MPNTDLPFDRPRSQPLCDPAKVEPLNRALGDTRLGLGMRREDAHRRADISLIGYDAKRDKVKLNRAGGMDVRASGRVRAGSWGPHEPLRLHPTRQSIASPAPAPSLRAKTSAGRWSSSRQDGMWFAPGGWLITRWITSRCRNWEAVTCSVRWLGV